MEKRFTVLTALIFLFLSAATVYPHLCDNVFRQADALIVKPEMYSLVVKDRITFKIFLQNNMDRGIAEISLIPESSAFDFMVTPLKMSIPKDSQVYFQVTLSPKQGVRTGNYPVRFRLVGGGREFKSFTLEGLAQEKNREDVDTSKLSQVTAASAAPVIDGNLNDLCWKNAGILSNFRSSAGPEPAYKTWVVMTFDRDNLYMGIMGKDESTRNLSPDDRLEIILSPGKSDASGFIMTFSPMGSPKYQRYNNEKQVSVWNPQGINHAVLKQETYWCIEISIPLTAMDIKYPADKVLWDMRFTRIKASGIQETSFWATDTTGYHSERGFGKIVVIP